MTLRASALGCVLAVPGKAKNTLGKDLLLNLAPSRNAVEALRSFGVTEGTTAVLVAAFDGVDVTGALHTRLSTWFL